LLENKGLRCGSKLKLQSLKLKMGKGDGEQSLKLKMGKGDGEQSLKLKMGDACYKRKSKSKKMGNWENFYYAIYILIS